MRSGLVSVIMPVHNSAATLAASIRSVQAQTMPDWELVVTDDGSSDGSWEVLTDLAAQDRRIRPSRSQTSGGPAAARNLAIGRAEGSYIAFLDSDDLWLPAKLERQLAFAAGGSSPLTFTSYYKVSADFGGEATEFEPNGRIITARDCLTYETLLQANYIGCLTAMYDRDVLGTRLMPTLLKRQDYALWLSILRDGTTAAGLDEPLALYRQSRPGSVSGNKLSLVKYNWSLYRDVERLSLPRSVKALATTVVQSVRNRGI